KGDWSANWTLRHIGNTNEGPVPATFGDIPSQTYHDLWVSYDVSAWRTRFTLGAENVFDKLPPSSIVNQDVNFDINTYNPRGAFVYRRAATPFCLAPPCPPAIRSLPGGGEARRKPPAISAMRRAQASVLSDASSCPFARRSDRRRTLNARHLAPP